MTRKFAFYVAPRFSMMSLLSMTEPLRAANEIAGRSLYSYSFFSDLTRTTAVNGMTIETQAALVKDSSFEAVIVCASYDPEEGITRKAVDWLRWLSAHGVVLGSADTGAYILAGAGLLDNVTVALHWLSRPAFESRFPTVRIARTTVEFSATRMSCAGATTGIDMMLHVIALNQGGEFSGKVANHFIHNNGKERSSFEQTALSELLQGIRSPAIRQALQLMEASGEFKLTIKNIAVQVGLPVKQLERQFKLELGESPSRTYQHMRLDRANALLGQTNLTVEQIATSCAFSSRTQFAAAFKARYGISPSQTRKNR